MTPIRWLESSPGFLRSACGRFDVVRTGSGWVAYDFDRPKRFRAATAAEAVGWCDRRRGANVDRIDAKTNGHRLVGARIDGKWILDCPSFPDLAEQYRGVSDASAAIDEFERRALAAGPKAKGAA